MDRRSSWFPSRAPTWRVLLALLALATGIALANRGVAGGSPLAPDVRFTLRVGYQPYFAEAWSGVLVRALKLHTQHLPRDVAVDFKVGMTGAGALVAALRRGDVDLAYLGLAPTLAVTQNLAQGDFRILAVSSVSKRLCNVILAQPGTVAASPQAALHWLDARQVAVPDGTCADFFLASVLERGHAHPARVMNQSFDVLATSFREHRVDAVAVWEPMASELVRTAGAVRLIDGEAIDEASATFIVVSEALLHDHADIVRGWLEAERAAQHVMASASATSLPFDALASQVVDLSKDTLRAVWLGPAGRGAWHSPATFPFAVKPEVRALLARSASRMAARGNLASPALRPGTVADDAARTLLAASAAGPVAPVGSGR